MITGDNKHAYLIMCHDNWEILKVLLQMIDHDNNDIYLHVDKHAKKYPLEELKVLLKKSRLITVKRIKVNWGGYSQIKAELSLIETAIKTKHQYYHLLSGVDLPIKSQEYIHQFFEENEGRNYLDYVENIEESLFRVRQYHLFQEIMGRKDSFGAKVGRRLEKLSLKIQDGLHIDRIKGIENTLYKGTNWFSITHELAEYVISQKKYIKKLFKHGICVDEMFLQTIAMNSEYADSVQNDALRYIDWNRGTPYTFRMDDLQIIMRSKGLFARKFDENVDFSVVNIIKDSFIKKYSGVWK